MDVHLVLPLPKEIHKRHEEFISLGEFRINEIFRCPESIRVVVLVTSPLTLKVTGISKTVNAFVSPQKNCKMDKWDRKLSYVQEGRSTGIDSGVCVSLSPPP